MLPLTTPAAYHLWRQQVTEEKALLNDNEYERSVGFRLSKRQDEWLTGRLCAKLALLHYCSHVSRGDQPHLLPAHISVGYTDSGRPEFLGLPTDFPPLDLAISHGAGFALALVAPANCGIDIQQSKPALLRVRHKYCTEDEQELLTAYLPELSERNSLSLLWSAKEAAKKALSAVRMPGFLELCLTGIEGHTGGFSLDFLISSRAHLYLPSTITVQCELYDGYAIAATVREPEDA